MARQPTAKIFATGGSQAIRLPAEFRFEGVGEVFIRRDAATGDVILSTRDSSDWSSFMRLRDRLEAPHKDFLEDREQDDDSRQPFEGWTE